MNAGDAYVKRIPFGYKCPGTYPQVERGHLRRSGASRVTS